MLWRMLQAVEVVEAETVLPAEMAVGTLELERVEQVGR